MFEIGCVARSAAGHDKNRFYAVVKVEDGFVWIADGRLRKLSAPKRKNPKHLCKTNTILPLDGMTDKRLRELLRPFNQGLGRSE